MIQADISDESAGEKASIYIDALDILAEDYSTSAVLRLFRNLLQLVKDSKGQSCHIRLLLILMTSSIPSCPAFTFYLLSSHNSNTPNNLCDSDPSDTPSTSTLILPLQSLSHAYRRKSQILADPRNRSISSSPRRVVIQRRSRSRSRTEWGYSSSKFGEESSRRIKRNYPVPGSSLSQRWSIGGQESIGYHGSCPNHYCSKWIDDDGCRTTAKNTCGFGFTVQPQFDGFTESC
jgi:hypothetical protein